MDDAALTVTPLRVVTLGEHGHRLTTMALEVVVGVPGLRHVGHVDSRDARSHSRPELEAMIRGFEPDLLLSAAYTRILPVEKLQIASIGAINVHPSLLPDYRGSHPVYWALYEGATTLGVTIHEMIAKVDSGAILAQEQLAVEPGENAGAVYDRLTELATPALRRVLEEIRDTRAVTGRPQQGIGSYRGVPWRERGRLVLDWSKPLSELVRGSELFPSLVSIPGGRHPIFVERIDEVGVSVRPPGTVLRRRFRSRDVVVGDGRVARLSLSRPARSLAKMVLNAGDQAAEPARSAVATVRLRLLTRRIEDLTAIAGKAEYWDERARIMGRSAVLNSQHLNRPVEAITEIHFSELSPHFAAALLGTESIVLDFGCGAGRFTPWLADMVGEAVGVDVSQKLLELAPSQAGVSYRHMNAGEIPLPDNSVDVVWINQVLGGIVGSESLQGTVNELSRVLRPGGLLFLAENTSPRPPAQHWVSRSVAEYCSLFPFLLQHIYDYMDVAENVSILAGRAPTVAAT